MPASSVPKELVALVSSPNTTQDQVVDALEEWILYRRNKGDTLFEVSIGLVELEEEVSVCT